MLSPNIRQDVYSFQKSVENKEAFEARQDQERNRTSFSIVDIAKRKISGHVPYGVTMKKPLLSSTTQVGLPLVNVETLLDNGATDSHRDRQTRELKTANTEELQKKMMSRAFEYAKSAKTSSDPCDAYHTAAVLFDNIMMYDRAVTYYNKALKVNDPLLHVDNVLMPYTDIEIRKLERMGTVHKKQYLEKREAKRQQLISEEEIHQERRMQDCFSRLFRVHLIIAVQEMSPCPLPSVGGGKVVEGGRRDQQLIDENLLKAHINLRAAFRAFHPDRMEKYAGMLTYAHEVLSKLLPPSSPEDGIYHIAVSGSAGPLAEAHIVILQELLSAHDSANAEYYEMLGQRFAEKCDFPNAQKNFKLCRDVRDAHKTPRYDSSVTLLRHHGDVYVQQERLQEVTTRPAQRNVMTANIGSDLKRTDLLWGRKRAIVKIPMSAFGVQDEDDEQAYKNISDFTYFRGKHVGSETRVYMPPSSGWDSLPPIDHLQPPN